MDNEAIFQPNWASPPGDTIRDVLNAKSITLGDFSSLIGHSLDFVERLICGNEKINRDLARKLKISLGAPESFWINRENQYREDLRYIENIREEEIWLDKLPIQDMIKYQWIKPCQTTAEKILACLRFFNVNTVSEWYENYHDTVMVTSFRTSNSFDSTPESVISWLQYGIKKAKDMECGSWDKQLLIKSIPEIKSLIREKEPKIFIPKLQGILAKSGVALVIAKTPKKCHASGAIHFVSPEKALLLLSLRYKSDDHFWFSLFHEVGHLIIHGNKQLFLEGLDESIDLNEIKMEKEANDFSFNTLIPEEYQEEFKGLNAREWKKIVRFAKKLGVSNGVMVGQLQYFNIIDFKQLNKLKTKFQWEDIDAI